MISADGFVPDAVLGILEGGGRVAENIFKDTPHFYTTLNRSTTKSKKWLSPLLRRLPRCVADSLRIAEARVVAIMGSRTRRRPASPVYLPQLPAEGSLLIVDDAVDSGHTLFSVVEAVKHIAPKLLIKTSVITITDSFPKIHPHYSLYNQKTLIRFPWSKDMTQKQQ